MIKQRAVNIYAPTEGMLAACKKAAQGYGMACKPRGMATAQDSPRDIGLSMASHLMFQRLMKNRRSAPAPIEDFAPPMHDIVGTIRGKQSDVDDMNAAQFLESRLVVGVFDCHEHLLDAQRYVLLDYLLGRRPFA